MMKGDPVRMKTNLSSAKGDLTIEKIDRAMVKGDLGKSTTKVDLGGVKANMGRAKVDLDEVEGVAFMSL